MTHSATRGGLGVCRRLRNATLHCGMGAGNLMANLTKGKIVPEDLVEKAIFKQFHQARRCR